MVTRSRPSTLGLTFFAPAPAAAAPSSAGAAFRFVFSDRLVVTGHSLTSTTRPDLATSAHHIAQKLNCCPKAAGFTQQKYLLVMLGTW